jgi:dTDP-4-dehydrorhamnose 3,5-epimerase
VILRPTPLPGAFVVEPERIADDRGFFARMFCASDFARAGLDAEVSQSSVSFNAATGTLRGLHFQQAPYAESKLVRCTQGAIYDVIVDLRPSSATFKSWFGVELSADNRLSVFVPKGLAHGFQTLVDSTEVYYQISVAYHSLAASGVRWNDPAFGIKWPQVPRVISKRDSSYPDFLA